MIVVETPVALPPDVGRPILFDLARDPGVHAASQSRYRENVGDRTGEGRLALGDEVTFEARHLGVSWRMTARVTALEPPDGFVDEQVRGPFAAFRHEHDFAPDGDRTVMRDTFRFRLPGGWAGSLMARMVVAPYLRRLLAERAAYLRDLAEAGPEP